MTSTFSKNNIYNMPSPQYQKTNYYHVYPKPIIFAKVIKKTSQNEIHSQSHIEPKLHINNFTNSSSSANGFIFKNQTEGNFPSYYSNENANLNMSSIYNSYSANPTYQNVKRTNIIKNNHQENNINYYDSNVKVLPAQYLPTKVAKPQIIYGNINFAKVVPITTRYKGLEYGSPRIQKSQNVNLIIKKTEKNINNISNQQTSFYPNAQNKQNNSYGTSQIPSYSIPITYSYSEQQISSYSTQEVPSYSTQQYNVYDYKNNNNIENINYEINNQLNGMEKIIDINTNDSINTNPVSDIVINESNIPAKEYNHKNIITKDIYHKPVVIKKNYLINSPTIYQESGKSPLYNSFIHKSPEITYEKNLFSPIQSPLSNYETQSYNGDENFNIEKILKLKEENEMYKQQLKELDKYKEQAAEANELKEQVELLSPIKEKLAEIDSLRAQLKDLNELKAKLTQLEKFQQKLEDKKTNEKTEKIKLVNKSQEKKKKTDEKIIPKKSENYETVEMEQESNEENDPNSVKGEILHSIEELSMIIGNINTNKKQIILNLLYKATSDSDRAAEFHKKCDNAKSTIVLIETDKGKRFGGYTSVNWKGKCLKKKDKDSFVFSLDNMKVFKNISGEKTIGCYPKFGPIFLGCQIRIYDNAFKNGGSTFKKGLVFKPDEDYALTGGERLFKIKEIEVYEVITQ